MSKFYTCQSDIGNIPHNFTLCPLDESSIRPKTAFEISKVANFDGRFASADSIMDIFREYIIEC